MQSGTIADINLAPWQAAALCNPYRHFAMYSGIACGKTFTGAQFVIKMIREHPLLTGFIGANSYDQLSQATLRELFYWLDFHKIPYVIDSMPPKEWGYTKKQFKKYSNILSVYYEGNIVTIFTRVLSDGDPLRGIEFSWYWLDETRDTPQNTHDIILSRMRESDVIKGIITTTTNGEDWSYQRFVRGQQKDDFTYGSMHVSTEESYKCGIISKQFLDDLLRSYSPMMALQEIYAKHVNVSGGRAYYTASEDNKQTLAPWGAEYPDAMRPLIVGCDFNYAPAPCMWVVGQEGPGEYSHLIHWFGEIVEVETSTEQMTNILMMRYPGFFYRIYGDASGNRGTTSNAGETDYNQIAATLGGAGCMFTIDTDQANPHVKKRVENVCTQLKNALGEVHVTYNPQTCPNLDGDFKTVGWKTIALTGKGKLDNAGDINRTHASDAAGYALLKLRPPGIRASLPTRNQSEHLAELRGNFQ